jgi:UDP-sugar diphosphatase
VLLYHQERDALLLVKQLRPAVYLHNNDGYTYELCAGIVDKEKELHVIAHEEIQEECGYHVPLEEIERVTSFYTSVGFAGSKQTLYFAQINESMRCGEGGGIEQEQIELIFLPRHQMESFVVDESRAKTPGLMYAFHWFLSYKKGCLC